MTLLHMQDKRFLCKVGGSKAILWIHHHHLSGHRSPGEWATVLVFACLFLCGCAWPGMLQSSTIKLSFRCCSAAFCLTAIVCASPYKCLHILYSFAGPRMVPKHRGRQAVKGDDLQVGRWHTKTGIVLILRIERLRVCALLARLW